MNYLANVRTQFHITFTVYRYTHLYLCAFYFYNYIFTVLSVKYSGYMHAYAWLIEICFRCLMFTSPDFGSLTPEPSTGLFRTKKCGTILATYYFAITSSTVPAPAQTTRNQPQQEVWHTAMCMLWARCRVSRYEHSSCHYSAMPHLRGVWQLEKMPFVVRQPVEQWLPPSSHHLYQQCWRQHHDRTPVSSPSASLEISWNILLQFGPPMFVCRSQVPAASQAGRWVRIWYLMIFE